MSLKIEWVDGAPDNIAPGMVIMFGPHLVVVGHLNYLGAQGGHVSVDLRDATKWGWLAQPHELEWIEHMAGREAKARPEE